MEQNDKMRSHLLTFSIQLTIVGVCYKASQDLKCYNKRSVRHFQVIHLVVMYAVYAFQDH